MPVSYPTPSTRRSPLRELFLQVYLESPPDEATSPLGEHGYSTLSRIIPSAMAVLRVAARIEPDPAQVLEWYRHTKIAEFGSLTAEQLVTTGRAPAVIHFLQSIHRGDRG